MTPDAWDAPPKKLAPGLKMGTPPKTMAPRIDLEPVRELTEEEMTLQQQNDRLRQENKELMEQIEQAWAVIRSRDELIESLQRNQ